MDTIKDSTTATAGADAGTCDAARMVLPWSLRPSLPSFHNLLAPPVNTSTNPLVVAWLVVRHELKRKVEQNPKNQFFV